MIWRAECVQTRQTIMMVGLAGLACLGGCTSPSKAQETAALGRPTPAFTVQTPIDRIAADERGKQVLDRDVPGVMSNPHYVLFSAMSLSQLASLSGGRLTQTKLKEVNADLAELSPGQ
ncbi:hypothetical protein [Acidocella sp.]|uniref:hypothetical protein n=1 Tax=Acidocella sp. TaxID=50710 RepID=UPI003D0129E6